MSSHDQWTLYCMFPTFMYLVWGTRWRFYFFLLLQTMLQWTLLCMRAYEAISVVSDSVRPYGLEPARILCPRHFPGKNTGVGCHALLLGVFPTQGSITCTSRWALFHQRHLGSPKRSCASPYIRVQNCLWSGHLETELPGYVPSKNSSFAFCI